DRALEAVCLKAMALEPADRYTSAQALAEDLERWLADEPVSALSEGWLARLTRWARRHRAWVRAGVSTLLAVSLASTLAAFLIRQAWLSESDARSEALRALKEEQDARRREATQRRAAQVLAASSSLSHGLGLIKDGEVNQGMLWLARSLKEAPP